MHGKSEPRNLNLELLRILSMYMIIFLHSNDHSGVYEALVPGTLLYYYEQFSIALVQVCVNCYVLISGYFLVKSTFKLRKLILLWIEVVFYALGIKLILMGTGIIPFSPVSLVSCFFPILTGRYWFVTIYYGMYLIFPFLNIWIRAMNQRQHGLLLLLLFALASCMVSIHPSMKGMNSGGGWGLAWFVVLYLTAAYLRLYGAPVKSCWIPLFVFFICPTLMFLTLLAAELCGLSLLQTVAINWKRYDSAPVFLASVALMVLFLNIKQEPKGKYVNTIIKVSSTTFGVYLIHAHANLCTEEVWQVLGSIRYLHFWWYPVFQIIMVIVVFTVCSICDLLRQIIFEKIHIYQFVDSIADRLNTMIPHSSGEEHR